MKTMKAETTKKHPGGRPSKRNLIDLKKLFVLVKKGFTNEELGEFFGVDRKTIDNYIAKDPEFFRTVKEAREIADSEIEKSLYEAAKGYACKETKVSFDKFGAVSEHTVVRNYPPDTVAAMFWLANRQRTKWQHISKIEHSGPDGGPLIIERVSYAGSTTEKGNAKG